MTQEKEPIRVAIIGTGSRASYMYGPILKALPGEVALVSVWGRSAGSAQRLAESLGVPWYTDLDRLIREPPPRPDVERAGRYAHFFFFRFMIPLAFVREEEEGGQVRIPLESLDELGPGRDAALDAVLDGLIEGRPIYHDPAG